MEEFAFLDMFPCCGELQESCGDLSAVRVAQMQVFRSRNSATIDVRFPSEPADGCLSSLSGRIAAEYGLSSVFIRPLAKQTEPQTNAGKKLEVIFGKGVKHAPIYMDTITKESGKITVMGKVFNHDSREVRNGAHVLSFSITDYHGSIHVSRFFKKDEDSTVISKIKEGAWYTIFGEVSYNRYEQDIDLEPIAIQEAEAPKRMDTAEEKRVELHLHTRFSSMDALTDSTEAVKTAARWGHKAIAVTDHGVAQAFPEFWKAGKKNKIKVIYGVEGYYVNDVDDLLSVHGTGDAPLDTDFVAFDIETTGLSYRDDGITEIGAVRYSNGVEVARFQTFVNPGRRIPPKISDLTGITDADVADAPPASSAVRDFLDFCGGLPLLAHNAQFDISFITHTCEACGYPFEPLYLDTLALSRCLLQGLKNHKLDRVAAALGILPFQHHRASDDADACGRIFLALCEKLRQENVEHFSDINLTTRNLSQGETGLRPRHIIILVKNKVGLKNLYILISESHLKHFRRFPIIPKSLLAQHRDGLIIGSACEAGEIFNGILNGRSDDEMNRLADFYDFLEIQPICNNQFLVAEKKAADDEALRDLNRAVVNLAHRLDKPVCATGDVHFLNPEDEIYRRILLASKKFSDADRPLPLYLKTTDEMLKEFSYLGAEECYDVVIRNPNAIADQVEEFELLPPDLFPPSIEHAAEDLERMVWERTHELYGDNPPAIVKDRVKVELDTILGHHYEVIYMSAQKLVQNSLEHGYLVGSRGSVGSSMVAYMSGITEVNSLPPHYRCPNCKFTDFDNVLNENGEKYGCGADMPDRLCPVCGTPLAKEGFDIPFETFLGFPGNEKTPDIDLNFSGEYQANAHKYTEELFGSDHVFRAGTIGTLADKTAYGYVKKYLEERGISVTKAEENRLAAGCVGVKRTTGQHPGGLVIIPQDKDVTDFCPVQHPADDADGGIITTHFEYHCMEDNLLKLDELGHDDPTMIRMLEDATGVNARTIPLDDPETMRIFTSPAPLGLPDDDPIVGKTGSLGIPEFGTNFTRQMLVDTHPEHFSTLVRLSGFSHGTDVWAGNIHDIVVNGIAPTDRCVSCRDDIMLYLISMGMQPKKAFKFMEDVRKGKIHKGGSWQEGIEEEMQQLGVPEWWVESCRKIQYLFPKAHAVAYVTMAFRIAWFKVHHPLAYYSAYFYRRSEKDGFDAAVMVMGIDRVREAINEIHRHQEEKTVSAKEEDLLTTLEVVYEFYLRGFSFAPLDIFKSDARRFLIEEGKLRPPFVSVSGLGETAAVDLQNCDKSAIISVEDLQRACPKVSTAHIEQLRQLGALGSLPDSNQFSLFDM